MPLQARLDLDQHVHRLEARLLCRIEDLANQDVELHAKRRCREGRRRERPDPTAGCWNTPTCTLMLSRMPHADACS